MFGAVDARVSVVSLPGRITVWVRGGTFTWRDADGRHQTHAWTDPQGEPNQAVKPARAANSTSARRCLYVPQEGE
ncbi:hypothetical protein [Nocardiopsis gilva]|uniref:hypothetical protein n=1 Tax=Nocardiopsis gilva TaxID=280236 RepID=UPI00034608A3|nr:hypothetical protein [Nocardiopsis gilva]